MIAKCNLHDNGRALAAYLVKGEAGDRAELVEMRGFAADNLRDAFRDVEIQARGTHAKAAFLHCYTRLPVGEALTPEQWTYVADRQEKRLHMSGQPRVIAFHHLPDGSTHMHIAWSRIALAENGKLFAIDPGLYKNTLKFLCRDLEKQFGLKEVSNDRKPGNRARAPDLKEVEESRRLGTNGDAIRNTILDCLEKADNGKALMAALKTQGLELAYGDKRDVFVVVDHAGGQHTLKKKLTGLTLEEMRARLSDIDCTKLPSIQQAQAIQRDRQGERQQINGHEASPPRVQPLGKTAGEVRTAWGITRTGDQFAQEIEKRGFILTYTSAEEVKASERAKAFAKAAGRQNRALKEGFGVVDARGNVTRIDQRTTGDQWEEIQKRLGSIDRATLINVTAARIVMCEANHAAWKVERAAEREAARPATWTENRIAECAEQARLGGASIVQNRDGKRMPAAEIVADWLGAMRVEIEARRTGEPKNYERKGEAVTVHGHEAFAARLAEAGIAIVRVTAADTLALDALRRDEYMQRLAAETNGEAYKGNRFAPLEAGELAAVTRQGDVYCINPDKLGDAARMLSETLPSVAVARAAFVNDREKIDQLWEQWQVERAGDREAVATEREERAEDAEARRENRQTIREIIDAVDAGFSAVRKAVEKAIKVWETGFSLLFGWAMAPAKRTKAQVHQDAQARGNVETRDAKVYADIVHEKEVEHGARQEAQNKAEQETDIMLAQTLGIPATREASLGRDQYDRQRERERDR